MRSRYSAYALGLTQYIIDTTDPQGPQWVEPLDEWRRQIDAFCATTRFRGLRVIDHGEEGDAAWVLFDAILTQGGRDARFSERSRFTRRDRRWLYHSGTRAPSR